MRRNSRLQHGLLLFLLCILGSQCAVPLPVSGLRPVYPEARHSAFWGVVDSVVDSLQPTLRWEAFPGHYDPGLDMSLVDNVTYDLRIFRVEHDSVAKLAYSRELLATPSHTIEHPLDPSAKYFWTVRARFQLNGHPRVTQWGIAWSPTERLNEWDVTQENFERTASRIPLVSHPFYYQFRTPSR